MTRLDPYALGQTCCSATTCNVRLNRPGVLHRVAENGIKSPGSPSFHDSSELLRDSAPPPSAEIALKRISRSASPARYLPPWGAGGFKKSVRLVKIHVSAITVGLCNLAIHRYTLSLAGEEELRSGSPNPPLPAERCCLRYPFASSEGLRKHELLSTCLRNRIVDPVVVTRHWLTESYLTRSAIQSNCRLKVHERRRSLLSINLRLYGGARLSQFILV